MSIKPRDGSVLPCHSNNNGNGNRRLQSNHFKSKAALAANIEAMFRRFGVEHVVVITLTFARAALGTDEVRRRWKSLRTGILNQRYKAWVCVVGLGRNERIHFHVLAINQENIREGFDFNERRKRTRPSANCALRDEWRFWHRIARRYGFGRTEAMPVRLPLALNRYLCRHVLQRPTALLGSRIVRYSRGWREHSTRFSFVHGKAREWRESVGKFFHPLSHDDVLRLFGSKWASHFWAAMAG